MSELRIIAIEGLDGAGKSTFAQGLHRRTKWPVMNDFQSTALGRDVYQYWSNRLISADTMKYFLAGVRLHLLNDLDANPPKTPIIMDRWRGSTFAYDSGIGINYPKEKVVIYLPPTRRARKNNTPLDIAMQERKHELSARFESYLLQAEEEGVRVIRVPILPCLYSLGEYLDTLVTKELSDVQYIN